MNVSDLYGQKIVSTTGKKGYIISVNASDEAIEGLVCADSDEREFIVDVKNIIRYGNEIVYEDRESSIRKAKPIRLGRVSYTTDGKYLGLVEEFVLKGNKITGVKIGAKKYPVQAVVFGDAAIVKGVKKLKSDVVKDGKVIIKKGTAITDEVMEKAVQNGEYIQTNLKSI